MPTYLSEAQRRMVVGMMRHPERPLFVRYLDGTLLRTAEALERKGVLTVKGRDGRGVDYLLTERGRAAAGEGQQV